MRKNLTISLAPEDWEKVRDMARQMGGTYSEVFHRLICAGFGSAVNEPRVAKYRALLRPEADYRKRRAAAMLRLSRRRRG
ncbi:MAG: hypothetical protein HY553_08250 [Elusimicrobia bacterium]|nr:hypothetical protein [Elusimicrobiota bacterium]